MICQKFHEKRTKPFYDTVCKRILAKNHSITMVSGFDQIDEIPVVKLSETDDYKSCIEKTSNCMVYHLDQKTNFDFFFIGDDDTYVNINLLERELNGLNSNDLAVYGCKRPVNFDPHFYIYGGSGILMNRKTFLRLAEYIKANCIKDPNHSDYSLALNIADYNKSNNNKINILNLASFKYLERSSVKDRMNHICTLHLKDSLYSEQNIYKLFE